jgi:hypothetical protein
MKDVPPDAKGVSWAQWFAWDITFQCDEYLAQIEAKVAGARLPRPARQVQFWDWRNDDE